MKYILIILAIAFHLPASSQTLVADTIYFGSPGNYTRVTFYRNSATTTIPPTSRLNDTAAAIRATVNTKAASNHNHDAIYSAINHTHTGVYQPVGSYLVAADIAGKLNTNGNGSQLTGITAAQVGAEPTITTLSFAKGGIGGAAAMVGTTGTISQPMTSEILTCTPSGAMTINVTGGVAGQRVTFVFTTSGTSSFVITFGTNTIKTGTLATGTTSGKKFAVSWIYDGTNWIETSRTAAM